MEKLISMTDFVLEQSSILRHSGDSFNIKKYDYIIRSEYYAKFLKQPLELWMFVPCNKNNNVLEEPLHIELYEGDTYDIDCLEYQQAKERCLFKGFIFLEGNKKVFHIENKKGVVGIGFRNGYYKTVEDIICTETNLTQIALKQIGL
jgi:hypothetical protein